MKRPRTTLAVVSSEDEITQAQKHVQDDRHIEFMALSLEAEFYLKKHLGGWENPLYKFLNTKSSVAIYKYLYPNFKIAYDFARNSYYQYAQDRIGYFLTELDRSLDFAKKVIDRIRPEMIICGEGQDYKGSSVINGSLKRNALKLVAKTRGITFIELKSPQTSLSLKQKLGMAFSRLRMSVKQKLPDRCDLLVMATARHVAQMADVIKRLRRSGIAVTVLTYNLTLFYKKRLDKLVGDYLEKERLMDSQMKKEAQIIKKTIIKQRTWRKFMHPKYQRNRLVGDFIRQKIKKLVEEEFDEFLADFPLAKSVIDRLKPKLLLTTTDPDTRVLSFIKYAKEKGLPSISIQHGAYFHVDPPSNAPASDYFITWSQMTKKELSQNPYFKKVKILIGQSPFHGVLKNPRKIARKKRSVLVLTAIDMMDINLKMYYYKKLFSNLEKIHPDMEFIIRPNPFQRRDDLVACIQNSTLDVRLDQNANLHDAIRKCDIVIYENTDAGLDAMLLGKPTIFFNPHSGEDFFGVVKTNASMTVLNPTTMEADLKNFLLNDSRWDAFTRRGFVFAKKYFGIAKRINRIEGIIKGKINRR